MNLHVLTAFSHSETEETQFNFVTHFWDHIHSRMNMCMQSLEEGRLKICLRPLWKSQIPARSAIAEPLGNHASTAMQCICWLVLWTASRLLQISNSGIQIVLNLGFRCCCFFAKKGSRVFIPTRQTMMERIPPGDIPRQGRRAISWMGEHMNMTPPC